MWLPLYKLNSTVCGCCFTGILARLAQQPSSHAQMLTTGTLDALLHLLSASFSAQIGGDDVVWGAQASSNVCADKSALCRVHRSCVWQSNVIYKGLYVHQITIAADGVTLATWSFSRQCISLETGCAATSLFYCTELFTAARFCMIWSELLAY